jgi:ribokinase
MTGPQIVVVGSHAPGLFVRVQRIPLPGETVIGWDFHEPVDGGKGSNQAIAASRLGARTSFVGCLGVDRIGEEGEKWMLDAGVDLRFLYHTSSKASGVGFIILDEHNLPAMVTAMGANEDLSKAQVESALSNLQGASVMLTQFEIPPGVALHAARVARHYGMLAIVNPAPAADVPLKELSVADILTPNETEARVLLGYKPVDPVDPQRMVEGLLTQSGAGCVIITLGKEGIVAAGSVGSWNITPPEVDVVDTSGAGDVFCAGLAAGIVRGLGTRAASEWACQAATLSVTRPGTIPAFPYNWEVDEFIRMTQHPQEQTHNG